MNDCFGIFSSNDYLHNIGLKFVAKLHSYSDLNRKKVFILINDIQNICKELVANIQKQTETLDISKTEKLKLDAILNSSASFLDCFDTEAKCFSIFETLNTFIKPVNVVVGQRPEFWKDCLIQKMISVPVNLQIIPLRKVLKNFFELPGVYNDIENYMEHLNSNLEIIENFVQAAYWKNRKHNCNRVICPIAVYHDDYENNNPIGSHKGIRKTGAMYTNILSLPPKYSSKLENIFVFALFNTIDKDILGNEIILAKIIEELRFLENTGITVNLPNGPKQIYFELGLIVGDNLGLHSLLGFVQSFNAESFCHKCLIKKKMINNVTSERNCELRNKTNYESLLLLDNVKESGIKERCVFNKLDHFHVAENVTVDPMHDILEGIARYDLANFLNEFIYKKKICYVRRSEF